MNRIIKYSGKLSFALLIVITIAMAVATFYEKANGTKTAHVLFYGSAWFIAIWATLAIYGLIYIITQGLYKRIISFCLHIALLLILVGALVTHISSINGVIRLRVNAPTHFYQDEDRGTSAIPFTLKLKYFDIQYYSGTQSPADYISYVEINDPLNNTAFEDKISMNNILSYRGYRFYQSSFDDDLQGSILSINRDVYGIPITYTGYYLLFISMLLMLLDKNGKFRTLLRSPILKKAAIFTVIAMVCVGQSIASPTEKNESVTTHKITIDYKEAKEFGKIWILYEGRIVPLQTFARDFTTKITGKTSYNSLSAEQFLAGYLLFPETWFKQMPIFDIQNAELANIIGNKKATLSDLFTIHGGTQHYKLAKYYKQIYQSEEQSEFVKEAAKLDEKVQIISMLQNGNLPAIFPHNNNGQLEWLSPNEAATDSLINNQAIKNFLNNYRTALENGDEKKAANLLLELDSYQKQTVGDILPSDTHRKVEILYNKLNIFSHLFKVCLILGLLSLIVFILQTIENKSRKQIVSIIYILLKIVFVVITIGLLLRTYIGGRLPLGNGYETMLFVSWCALLIAVCLRRYSLIIPSFGFLIAGFALLVAHLGAMNPKIGNLVPVLSSPLLSIHVSVIMFSYALAGFMALNSFTTFLLLIFGKKNNTKPLQSTIKKLQLLSEILLYPCVFFLAAGIFIGAIWANVSWGRYWGWDPKEVWALITFLLAALPFHSKTLSWFRNIFFYNIYMLLLFASILMTYFGVNYFLGGMHSYAGDAQMGKPITIILIVAVSLIALISLAYKKYRLIFKN